MHDTILLYLSPSVLNRMMYLVYCAHVGSAEDSDWHRGEWKDGKMHGPGTYYHVAKGQVFKGTWVKGVAKCGTIEDHNRETAKRPPLYDIPEVGAVFEITVCSVQLFP